ncbi:MAG: DEAD/DEAH box helicase [Planctomycetes bacterium]|nr:DEAD/DEAH box helicase [Planctomycetota bacterium]
MPTTQLDENARGQAKTADVTRTEPLQLEISLAEAQPWPGMTVRAAVRYGSALIRLRKLQIHGERFILHQAELIPDAVDALIVRALLGLQTADGVAYRVPPESLAPMLALLRRASPNTIVRQTEAIERCAVLDAPPVPQLSLRALSFDQTLRILAAPEFLCAETGRSLGAPAQRGRDWWIFAEAVCRAPQAIREAKLRGVFEKGERIFEGEEAWEMLRLARAASAWLDVKISPADLAEATAARVPRPALRIEPAGDGAPVAVKATLTFEAPGATLSAEEILQAAERGVPCLRRNGVWCRVDPDAVKLARKTLAGVAKANGAAGSFLAAEEQIPELLAWAHKLKDERNSPWNVYVAEAVEGAHHVAEEAAELRLRLDVEEEGREAWFRVEAAIEAGGRALSPQEIERLMKQRKKWLRAGHRWVKLDPKALEAFRLHAQKHGFQPRGPFAFRFRAEAREKVEQLFSLAGTVEHSEAYRAFIERLKTFEKVESTPVPQCIELPLREYQVHGYQWMRFLARYGLNGILADDMGLGKTAQTIAALAAMREELGNWPSLIVCPTSLVDNWRAEFRKFDPRMKVMRYGGAPSRRDRLRKTISENDVVLATYATVRNDASLLKDEQWRYVILDEAHAIKNASAAVTKAVKTIPARHKLALTGTPVQNRLDELWSLFDFLMPGFLGRRASFFHQYEEPISKGQSPGALLQEKREGEQVAEHLCERIKPFVLRRLKTEVAKELPDKIEQNIPCSLTADQSALYRQFAQSDEAKQAVKELEEHGAGRAQTEILTALMSLRKICNHPDLVYLAKERAEGKRVVPMPGFEERSGKLLALADLLDQCREGGHRALIFCQLTSMLDILEHFLHQRGEKWLRLDGGTPGDQRQDLVNRFNAEQDVLAFLISTRAGGSGLNLTGADTVIFYDHDWNPANDRQAQDRAYRIGQTRNVNVYKLVTSGTFEEKVLARQALKLSLADSVVKQDPSGFKDLAREELLSLFTLSE